MRAPRLLAAILAAALTTRAAAAAEQPVTVFAAASLKGALAAASAAWAAQGHPPLRISLESSGTLARQIQQGAPAQIFISADEKWMDYLARQSLIVPATRKDLLSNTLVLVAPAGAPKSVTLAPGFDLPGLLGPAGRLAVGDPATVPAGIYARQALTRLGVWAQAEPRLAPAANVKAALLLVEAGQAPAGIVYGTDAGNDPKVRVIATFPPDSHDPITYPIALIAKLGETPDARAALAFLRGPAARESFTRAGFGTP